MKKTILACLIGVLAFTGCTMTPEECDPSSDPGFFNKIGCTVSGSYSQRVEQKEQNLAKMQDENGHLKKLLEQAQNEQAMLSANRQERQAQLSAIQSELASLRAELDAQSTQNKELAAALQKAQDQAEAMQNSPGQQAVLERRMQLQELKDSLEELESFYYQSY